MRKRSESTGRVFLPWFLSMEVHRKIERLLPYIYHQRLRKYFELYGCIHCQRKNRLYYSNGLCGNCSSKLNEKLRRCDRLMMAELAEIGSIVPSELLEKIAAARDLLGDLVKAGPKFRRERVHVPKTVTLDVRSR